MEFETRLFLFFLIIWSFALQIILTISKNCYNKLERWSSFAIYIFITLLFCGIRYYNYQKYKNQSLLFYNNI